jgi:Na+-driven multidrug efflux pump
MSELLDFDRTFLRWVASRSLPVALNETFWSLGVTTYSIVYARISTEALAAMNITVTIEQIGFVIFIGIADATAILVGNKIGAGETETAYRYAGWSLVLAMVGAIGIGFGLMAASSFIIGFYQVSPGVAETARRVLIVVAFTMWVRVSNMTLIVGILRSGGDTRFSFILDSSTVWLVGVPLAFLGAFTFKLPVYWVYLLILSEEFVKMGVCLYRYLSRKWINDLTQVVAV